MTRTNSVSTSALLARMPATLRRRSKRWAVAAVLLGVACGNEPGGVVPDDCIEVSAAGSSEGDIRTLHGTATFRFDGRERPAEVGIYLNNIREVEGGSLDLTITYQFSWDNGDLFLTDDPVRFLPALVEGEYDFSYEMTLTSGKGMFASYSGQRPFRLSATIVFGEPATTGGLQTAVEEFTLGGRLCTVG